eukprot:TRINITY_DN1054_c0_g3_i1.p1 TRINITY_DN1054_c0_g3~~TRINITY_DN1054_c0_g3_i1.p1  ORF type:complete len:318 (+),score=81.66 TRINITY_DN1054_c0_g3_i1:62-1015(+)
MRLVVGLAALCLTLSAVRAAYCSERGGCACDCSWTQTTSCAVAKDDGSCCFGCCCGSSSTPTSAPSGGLNTYCPAAGDLAANGGGKVYDQGWSIWGGGGAGTKSTFNLLGGSVEFDIDFSGCHTGVNCNIYTVSPWGISSAGYDPSKYCDGSKTDNDWCVEVDWIESNGNCGGATSLHTVKGPGSGPGCTAWGCTIAYHYNGRPSFHMKLEFKEDGTWTTTRDGNVINGWNMNPQPSSSDWSILSGAYKNQGALIYSSQWTGWVPTSDCGTSGDLGSSGFSVKNLRITGSVVQGPVPRVCNDLQANAAFNTTIVANW